LSHSGTLELVCLKFENNPSEFIVDLQGSNAAVSKRVRALKRLFENDQVTNIIHACIMDCNALVHHCDIKLTTVHDTSSFHEVLTGRRSVGLTDLLAHYSMDLNLHRDNNINRYNY
jgi:ribonuclease D